MVRATEPTARMRAALAYAARGCVSGTRVAIAISIRASDAIRSAVPVFQPQAARLAKLSADLRSKFDPSGVLNPGRMVA